MKISFNVNNATCVFANIVSTLCIENIIIKWTFGAEIMKIAIQKNAHIAAKKRAFVRAINAKIGHFSIILTCTNVIFYHSQSTHNGKFSKL